MRPPVIHSSDTSRSRMNERDFGNTESIKSRAARGTIRDPLYECVSEKRNVYGTFME